MKRSVHALLAMVLALGPIASQAADPEKIHKYFEIIGEDKIILSIVPTLINGMVANAKMNNPNLPADTAEIVSKVVTDTLKPLLPEMLATSEKVYAANLTDEEADAAISFYGSAVGQSLLKKLPTLTQQGAQANQALIVAHMPEIQQRMLQELQQRHPELFKK